MPIQTSTIQLKPAQASPTRTNQTKPAHAKPNQPEPYQNRTNRTQLAPKRIETMPKTAVTCLCEARYEKHCSELLDESLASLPSLADLMGLDGALLDEAFARFNPLKMRRAQ